MFYTMRPAGTKLSEGLKAFIATVPDGCVMAEIGCYAGEGTRLFLSKAAHLTAVDAWVDYVENNAGNIHVPVPHMADVERAFDALVADHPQQITKRKGYSVDVAATVPDASFDLVYIDANHGYEDVCADIQAWRPKVKPGGLLAGHDYEMERHGVIRAVQELIGEPDAVFADSTWVKRIPPGPKAEGPVPRLTQDARISPHVLIGIPALERSGYRPFEMCLQQLMEGRPDTRVFYAMGAVVPGARNRIVREALKTGAEYIWFLDDDQPFFAGDPANPNRPNDLDQLLSHRLEAVIPLSVRRAAPFLPLLHSSIHPTESLAVQRYLLPDDHGLIPIAGAGLAGLLIKTSVFLRIGLDGWFEFTHPSNNFDDYAEDIPFYRKLEQAGVQLYCDLDISFGHAITSVAYALKHQGQWMTVFADSKPYMMAPQPQHPLGISYSEQQRHKLVPV